MILVPFEAEHLRELVFQPAQDIERTFMTPEEAGALEGGQSWTAIDDDTVLGVGGLMDLGGWNGQRQIAWCVLRARLGGPALLGITRRTIAILNASPARRIEASVKAGFRNGWKWAERLGFEFEGTMRGYGHDGSDYHLFARVRK